MKCDPGVDPGAQAEPVRFSPLGAWSEDLNRPAQVPDTADHRNEVVTADGDRCYRGAKGL